MLRPRNLALAESDTQRRDAFPLDFAFAEILLAGRVWAGVHRVDPPRIAVAFRLVLDFVRTYRTKRACEGGCDVLCSRRSGSGSELSCHFGAYNVPIPTAACYKRINMTRG